jgi:putative membrane protein
MSADVPPDADSKTGGEIGRASWPAWVYAVGAEPDPRFSLANERTFLAWVRTSLALLAGGVALDAVELDGPDVLQTVLAVILVVLGLLGAAASWWRWAAAERAMRLRRSLPRTAALAWLAVVLMVVAVGLVVLVL